MFVSRKFIDNCYLSVPILSLATVCLIQWLLIPNTGFYLVFDKLILFYWLIYRPDRISIFWVCILYLVPDLKEGWTLGFSSLTTLFFIWFVLLQRHVLLQQTFLFQWFVLAVLLGIYFTFLFVTYSFIASHGLAILPMVTSSILGLFTYPLFVRYLCKLQLVVPMYGSLED
jgi:rod shape-determining protein MreD